VVFIANPNNPTGTLVAAGELEGFLSDLPREIVVVLDEAYNEYLEEAAKADSIGWLKRFPNLIVTRTFSKVYGLAGLRVGYAFAGAGVADLMNRVRQPFNVNSVALAAATAALGDHEFVRRSFELNRAGMKQVTSGLKRLEIEFIPSFGNFVSFRVGDGAAIFQDLLRKGVIVRPIASYGMPAHLRVTIGLEAENTRFLAALGRALR
jgi:histidinol-phosphate aminotransferase